MAKVFKHVGLWLAVLFAALCTAGLLVVHAQGENNALYQTVLGKAVNFGITASTLNHESDLQTNFATKHYTNAKGQHANPNLTGTTTPGDFLIGQMEMDHVLKITEGPSANSTYYVTQKDVAKVKRDDQNQQPNVNTNYTKDQLDGFVEDMINSALSEGGKLANQPATANVVIKTGQYDDKVTIDTTALGDNETIYVDPSSNEKCYKALSTNGNLTIKKKPNQNIVFNITTAPSSGTTLDLAKYAIETTDGQSFDTAPDSNVGDTNKRLDSQAQHIFFNVRESSRIKNVKLTNTAGIFLLQNADASVGGTSSGWIVTNKSFTNDGGEWHYIHPSPSPWSPTTTTKEKGSLTFTKTFGGGVTEEDLSNISFTVTGPDNYSKTFTLGDIKQNDGTYSKTLTDLTLGKYTVTENKADNVEGYSLVKEGTITSGETTLTTSSKTATIALNDNYQPTKPEQPTEEKGSLTFTKTFGGDNVTAEDLKNISFEVKGPNNYDQVFFLKDIKKDDGTYSKTLTDLEWGKYTVTEKYADDVNGYKLEETSIVKGSTEISGTQLKGTVNLNDTYTQKKGSLTFTKTFGGGVTEEDLSNISFNVTGPHGYNQTYSLADIKNTDGTYSKTLNNLKWGTYTVKEINADKVNG